jgi:hypothetical protein
MLHALANATLHPKARIKIYSGPADVTMLDLASTKVTDAGVKELKALKNLQSVDVSFTSVTDVGLKELKEFKSLQELYLFDTKVTDAGAKELQAARPELRISR